MNITKYEKYFFILPGTLVLLALIAVGLWGLRPGIDLVGGSFMEVSYSSTRPTADQMQQAVAPLNLGEVRIQPTESNSYILRERNLTNDEHTALLAALDKLGNAKELQFTSVGPILGAELLSKAWIAIALVVISIIIFIAWAFRKVSKPVQSWKYGVVAIITLLHDVIVPVGLFALLGHIMGAEVDSLFIVALLTILGISINDTIVVFDRIRENLRLNEEHHKREEFDEVVGRSIMQTVTRSINTSVTVVIVLAALYFVGPVSTQSFALTLIVGMIAGTYSSIFLASPLLVVWERFSRKDI